MSDKKKSLVVVLGMHRSGTSAITRGLQVMGIDLGGKLSPSMEGINDKGFWEDIDLNTLNIEILSALDSDWYHLAPIEPRDVETLRKKGYFLRASELIRQKIGDVPVFGFKDPRVAKLLPFWKAVFSHCQIDVSYVLVVRHPLSVVKSLTKRDGIEAVQSYLLWLAHVLTSLIGSAGNQRVLVDYDRLMHSPDSELIRIAKCTGQEIDHSELQSYKSEFLDKGLRHSVYELNDLLLDDVCPPIVREMYPTLLEVASDKTGFDSLENKLMRWSDEFERLKSPLLLIDRLFTQKLVDTHAIAERDNQIVSLNQAMADRDGQIVSLNQEVAERDNQVVSLNQAMADRDGQIVSLNQEVAERDNQIVSLNQAMADRDGQIVSLNQEVAERDNQVVSLNQAMAERDNQIVSINHAVTERDAAVALVNLIKYSKSWRITRPLRFFARLARYGLTNEDQRQLIQGLRHQYHGLLLPSPVNRLVGIAYHKVFAKVISAVSRRALPTTQFHEPTIKPASKHKEGTDFIFWGVIDWHFRHQRPQQLALALSASSNRIFYVSPSLVDDERTGFAVEALDASGLVFQIKLYVKGAPVIYSAAPGLEIITQLRAGIGEVLDWADCKQLVSVVQHPFWCDIASVLPGCHLVYDCMDHHEGFGNVGESLVQLEKTLFSTADLTVTTSAWLDQSIAEFTQRRALIRNACEFEYFSKVPESVYCDPQGRHIIGYYGAIAEWFDVELIEAVAKHHLECCVLLIGADTVNARSRLGKLPNVIFTGEVPYSKLTYYLYSFDVCLLPFKVIPLTLATNPVKVYEYLSTGKSVVSVNLPEIAQFDGLVYVAKDQTQFLKAVDTALTRTESEEVMQRRKFFAEGQTWRHRAETLILSASSIHCDSQVSIVVVAYNNLELTRACLASLDEHSQYDNKEIIVVDNASSDGTPEFLRSWASAGCNRKLILNDENRGFAAANNQGLSIATGDFLALLNNDTYVTPGWVRTLVKHLKRDKSIGLIGPVTNNIGNEAKIDIHYANMEEMLVKSAAYTRRHVGQLYPLRTAAFFCVMMSKEIYKRVGPLDEAFGRGFFEDDDYCRRIESLGLRVVCAEDVFVHHHLSASFNKLKQKDRQQLFEENMKIYETKWGKWLPHAYRASE